MKSSEISCRSGKSMGDNEVLNAVLNINENEVRGIMAADHTSRSAAGTSTHKFQDKLPCATSAGSGA